MAEYLRDVHLGFTPSEGEIAGAVTMVEVAESLGRLSPNDKVTLSLRAIEQLRQVLLRKCWSLEFARKPRFLTSDAPLVAWHKPTPADEVPLAEGRPTLRFNLGPGYRVHPDGTEEAMGEILHMWVQRAVYPSLSARGWPKRR